MSRLSCFRRETQRDVFVAVQLSRADTVTRVNGGETLRERSTFRGNTKYVECEPCGHIRTYRDFSSTFALLFVKRQGRKADDQTRITTANRMRPILREIRKRIPGDSAFPFSTRLYRERWRVTTARPTSVPGPDINFETDSFENKISQ